MYKKAANTFVVNSLGLGLAFGLQLILARVMGDVLYGEANFYLGFSSTIVVFTYFGLQMYISKNVQFAKSKEEFFSEVVSTITVVYLIITPILFVVLRKDVNLSMLFIIVALSYFTIMVEVISSFYLGIGQSVYSVFVRKGLPAIVQIVLFFAISMYKPVQPIVFVMIMLISNIVVSLPTLFKYYRKFKFSVKVLKDCWLFYVTQVLGGLYIALSKILQKSAGGFGSVGVLSISLTLGNIVNLFGDTFARLSMPMFSKAHSENDIESIKNIYRSMNRMNSYLVLPIAIAVLINSRFVLNLVGEGFSEGVVIFQMVLISQIINSFTGPNGTLLNMSNYEKYEVYNAAIKFIVSLIIGFWFGPKYYFGIALAIAAGEILINILKTIQVKQKFGFYPFTKSVGIYILILTVVQTIVYRGLKVFENNFIVFILVNGIVTVFIYVATFYFSPDQEDKDAVKNIISKINMFIKKKNKNV